MVLIMLPMWMNFLLRTYSWMSILENNGLLNQLFRKIGLIALYNRPSSDTDITLFPDDQYPGGRGAGHGV